MSSHRPAGFGRLVWSNLAAQSGEQIALAAAPLVAVTALEASAAETSLLQAALTLPFVIFALPAGLMPDPPGETAGEPVVENPESWESKP